MKSNGKIELLNDIRDHYLRSLENEKERMNGIEKKLYQVLNNSGFIVSLVGVFLSILYNNSWNEDFQLIKMIFGILLSITFIFIGLSIYIARKIFNVKKFIYMDVLPNPAVSSENFEKIEDFKRSYIYSLIKCLKHNMRINNKKANIGSVPKTV